MERGTIITLAPPTLGQEIATFEEAFGEYSEARGRGKARRAARKKKRVAKKTARKSSRVAERDKRKRTRTETKRKRKTDKRTARVADRMARRKQRKTGRMSARQEKRNLRTKSRMDRRRFKADERAYRKGTRGGDEEEYEEDYYPEEVGYDDEPYEQDGYGEDGFEDDYGDEGYGDDYGYGDEDSYDDGYDDDYDDGYDDYDDEYEDQTGGNFGDDDYDYDDGMTDDEWADEPYDDYEDDDWGYFDATSGVDGELQVNPKVQKITDKIEWNKEWISRARVRVAEAKGRNNAKKVSEIGKKINERLDKIAFLENKLARFMDNAKGGDRQESRRRHIGLAKRGSMSARKEARERSRMKAKGLTPVEAELNPNITKDEIVVPASNATGLNGLDLQDDFEAPNARVVELTSNADGDGKKKFPVKPVLVGVGIALAVIGIMLVVKKQKGKK